MHLHDAISCFVLWLHACLPHHLKVSIQPKPGPKSTRPHIYPVLGPALSSASDAHNRLDRKKKRECAPPVCRFRNAHRRDVAVYTADYSMHAFFMHQKTHKNSELSARCPQPVNCRSTPRKQTCDKAPNGFGSRWDFGSRYHPPSYSPWFNVSFNPFG